MRVKGGKRVLLKPEPRDFIGCAYQSKIVYDVKFPQSPYSLLDVKREGLSSSPNQKNAILLSSQDSDHLQYCKMFKCMKDLMTFSWDNQIIGSVQVCQDKRGTEHELQRKPTMNCIWLLSSYSPGFAACRCCLLLPINIFTYFISDNQTFRSQNLLGCEIVGAMD
ncbi:hypothetical protein SADUNF_Sadunf03G0090200 [Salix dunnii]|uniref:Uncharacterized protein n=1 Tax=Salix dunnii TaxID=1413687 RepID=A0A835K9U2_9ROSI|nr:hypothetical protein SADUNF_Sadunf03G0090200 [Salix dunnii]